MVPDNKDDPHAAQVIEQYDTFSFLRHCRRNFPHNFPSFFFVRILLVSGKKEPFFRRKTIEKYHTSYYNIIIVFFIRKVKYIIGKDRNMSKTVSIQIQGQCFNITTSENELDLRKIAAKFDILVGQVAKA